MRTLSIDIETYSDVDLGACGVYKYVESPNFEVMLFAYSFDFEPAVVVDIMDYEDIPEEVVEALFDPSVVKRAYNAPFERACLAKHFGRPMPPEQWRCDMVLGAVCGLPLGLAAVSEALGLGEDKAKMKEGKDLVRYFCLPCKPTKSNGFRTRNLPEHAPEKWEKFKQYNGRDVDAENEITKMLLKYDIDDEEQKGWVLDQEINDRGVKLDLELVANAIKFDELNKASLTEEAIRLTGLNNPNSVAQVKEWLKTQEGIEVESLNKSVMPDVLASLTTEESKEFLALRNKLSKTSVKKYEAMDRCACNDHRAKGLFQFYGTRTGRFAGRLLQLQNFPQNHMPDLDLARQLVKSGDYDTFTLLYDDVSSVLSELLRTAIIPEEGHKFIVCDFSAIEARVTAWMAHEQWRMDVFANNGDIYCASASQMFKVPVEKNGINGHLRQKGKVAELALGYGGAVGALKAFGADKMGMTEEEMQETVTMWRDSSPNIVSWWWSMDNAAKRAISRKTTAYDEVGGITFSYENGLLFMKLPSGRSLCYYNARIVDGKFGKPVIGYMGTNQKTRKWEVIETYGPKLVENCVQAVARDCLLTSMKRLAEAGYKITMHIHDEVVIEEPINGRSLAEVEAIMSQPIPWAKGLLLRGDGDELPYYQKA